MEQKRDKLLSLEKATVYRSAMFGWVAVEAHDVLLEYGPYAQYARALHVSYRRPRKRSREGFVDAAHGAHNRVVVIKGWGHPALVRDPLEPSALGGSVTRYASFDPAYTVEFREALAAYQREHVVEVHDYMAPVSHEEI